MNISYAVTPEDNDAKKYGLQYLAQLLMAHGTHSQSIMAQQIAELSNGDGDERDIELAESLAEGIIKEQSAFIEAFTEK